MLNGEVELMSERTGLPGRENSIKRFERSNGPDIALYKNDILCYTGNHPPSLGSLLTISLLGTVTNDFQFILYYASLIPITSFVHFSANLFNK